MSSTENFLKAALNRLKVRFDKRLVKTAIEIVAVLKNAPVRLRTEWEEFKEEVITEADRLDQETTTSESEVTSQFNDRCDLEPQEKIDQLRAKIAKLNETVEGKK